MTPIFGLIIAIVVGLLAPSRRSAALAVIPPQLAVTAAQSWYLGTGRGDNPPSTTTGSPAYWVVQLVILAIMCGVAFGIAALRHRFAGRRGTPGVTSGSSGTIMIAVGTVAAAAVTLGTMFLTDRPAHQGSGDGNLPVTGIVGISLGLAAILAFVVFWLRGRHASAGETIAR
jgi:hypothetical protein